MKNTHLFKGIEKIPTHYRVMPCFNIEKNNINLNEIERFNKAKTVARKYKYYCYNMEICLLMKKLNKTQQDFIFKRARFIKNNIHKFNKDISSDIIKNINKFDFNNEDFELKKKIFDQFYICKEESKKKILKYVPLKYRVKLMSQLTRYIFYKILKEVY